MLLKLKCSYFQSNRSISIKKEKERQEVFQNSNLGKEKAPSAAVLFLITNKGVGRL